MVVLDESDHNYRPIDRRMRTPKLLKCERASYPSPKYLNPLVIRTPKTKTNWSPITHFSFGNFPFPLQISWLPASPFANP